MPESPVETLSGRDVAFERLGDLIRNAERNVMLYTDEETFRSFADDLAAARDRGVMVLALVEVGADAVDDDLLTLFEVTTTVARTRHFDGIGPTGCVVDTSKGFTALETDDRELHEDALVYDHLGLHNGFVLVFYTQFLAGTTEQYTAPPRPLPATYDDFYHAVVDATQYLGDGRDLWASVEATPANTDDGEAVTLTGFVATARQNFVRPRTNAMFGETSLVLRTGSDRVTVGGPGGFVEDYIGQSVRLLDTPPA